MNKWNRMFDLFGTLGLCENCSMVRTRIRLGMIVNKLCYRIIIGKRKRCSEQKRFHKIKILLPDYYYEHIKHINHIIPLYFLLFGHLNIIWISLSKSQKEYMFNVQHIPVVPVFGQSNLSIQCYNKFDVLKNILCST